MVYIKKLVMKGFKSFPKKTEIPFTQGINIILGPNGSGKSNISDALCFALGRLSIKSMRAAKSKNLIFLGTKNASPAKETFVEIVFDNSDRAFSLENQEIYIKRILRKNGQSIYKINDETKTRQEVLSLLAQAGIDPNGFNIILQGEIQNFVRMHNEERRKIIEEVSGISVYETRKVKSLRELDRIDDKLKEISAVLNERNAYLNNLEKERQQALRYKKIEKDIKRLKAGIISYDLAKKKKETDFLNKGIEDKNKKIIKIKKEVAGIESSIKFYESKIDSINSTIKESTGLEQEKLNQEIANLRADLAGDRVKSDNLENKIYSLKSQEKELRENILGNEESMKDLEKESPGSDKKQKEIEFKKKKLEELEKERKKYYMLRSELKSLKQRIQEKRELLQGYESDSNLLIKQIENLSIELFDKKSDHEKLEKLKVSLEEKKHLLEELNKKETELEKKSYTNEYEIEKQKVLVEKVSKMDICPLCRSKMTREHLMQIRKEVNEKISGLKKEISSSDRQLSDIDNKKSILIQDIEQINAEILKREHDLIKLSNIKWKSDQIKTLQNKKETVKKELSEIQKREKYLERKTEEDSNIEEKCETLRIEMQEISLRTKENINSEISFRKRELDRARITLKQLSSNYDDLNEELSVIRGEIEKKEKRLKGKREREEELSRQFEKLLREKEAFNEKIKQSESSLFSEKNSIMRIEESINELRITKAKVEAEAENLNSELSEFRNIEPIKAGANRELLVQRLDKAKEIFSRIGSVNLRSLEVYDSVKKEYEGIREKMEIIVKEKESILKIIKEIDIKKKKAFLRTLASLNERFSRNFSQLSPKGEVWLESENKKEPFEQGSGVQIIVKTGHGKYFEVTSLSGGEQTLVALSLIFAIQELNPYYFYMLDEIDAALDKRNSERLAGLLKKYMKKGQYIIVTHNDEIITKATSLYGVSMHEGISKIVSLKV